MATARSGSRLPGRQRWDSTAPTPTAMPAVWVWRTGCSSAPGWPPCPHTTRQAHLADEGRPWRLEGELPQETGARGGLLDVDGGGRSAAARSLRVLIGSSHCRQIRQSQGFSVVAGLAAPAAAPPRAGSSLTALPSAGPRAVASGRSHPHRCSGTARRPSTIGVWPRAGVLTWSWLRGARPSGKLPGVERPGGRPGQRGSGSSVPGRGACASSRASSDGRPSMRSNCSTKLIAGGVVDQLGMRQRHL